MPAPLPSSLLFILTGLIADMVPMLATMRGRAREFQQTVATQSPLNQQSKHQIMREK